LHTFMTFGKELLVFSHSFESAGMNASPEI
jgi:hypothetical protein